MSIKMKYHKLTNPFWHYCCGCGLAHKVHIKINKSGDLSVGFEGSVRKTLQERRKMKK